MKSLRLQFEKENVTRHLVSYESKHGCRKASLSTGARACNPHRAAASGFGEGGFGIDHDTDALDVFAECLVRDVFQ